MEGGGSSGGRGRGEFVFCAGVCVGPSILMVVAWALGTWYLVVAYRGNGGIRVHRGIYQLQGDDNGHVGRPR